MCMILCYTANISLCTSFFCVHRCCSISSSTSSTCTFCFWHALSLSRSCAQVPSTPTGSLWYVPCHKALFPISVNYYGQAIAFSILNVCVCSSHLVVLFDGNLLVFPTTTVTTAFTYIKLFSTQGEITLILKCLSPGSCFDYYHHERGS